MQLCCSAGVEERKGGGRRGGLRLRAPSDANEFLLRFHFSKAIRSAAAAAKKGFHHIVSLQHGNRSNIHLSE